MWEYTLVGSLDHSQGSGWAAMWADKKEDGVVGETAEHLERTQADQSVHMKDAQVVACWDNELLEALAYSKVELRD